jgi:hypothetical protein
MFLLLLVVAVVVKVVEMMAVLLNGEVQVAVQVVFFIVQVQLLQVVLLLP